MKDSSCHRDSEVGVLEALQRAAFGYFQHETNPANGLVIDRKRMRLGVSVALRPQSGADHHHDRELLFRLGLATDAAVPLHRYRVAACRIYQRLVILVTRQLEDEGVEKFNQPFDKLPETLAQRSPRHLARES
jgi:hypothetical protein